MSREILAGISVLMLQLFPPADALHASSEDPNVIIRSWQILSSKKP